MKKRNIIILMTLMVVSSLAAQHPPLNKGDNRKQLFQDKVTFINRTVGFTDDEAAKFWPLYDTYRQQLHASRQAMNAIRKLQKTTQKDYQDALNLMNAERSKRDKYDQDFYNQLVQFLSPQKIYLYFESEEMYKRQLVRHIENRGPKK